MRDHYKHEKKKNIVNMKYKMCRNELVYKFYKNKISLSIDKLTNIKKGIIYKIMINIIAN